MPTAVDTILITHFHPDHVADLVPFLFALRSPRFAHEHRWPRLIGPVGFADLYEGLRAPFMRWIPPAGEIEVREWEGEELTGKGVRITAAPMRHTESCLGYRVRAEAEVVVFSGDTEECEEIIELARGADLLFLECSFPRGSEVAGHLGPDGVSGIVRRSGARRVVLVHLNPECDQVNLLGQIDTDVRGRVCLGRDLETYAISDR